MESRKIEIVLSAKEKKYYEHIFNTFASNERVKEYVNIGNG